MILSFAMMGSAIIVLALTPSYAAIGIAAPIIAIVARMVQGFSLGGEVGPTTAYLMEAARAGPARACGVLAAGEPADRRDRRRAGRHGAVQLMTSAALEFLWLAHRLSARRDLPAVRPVAAHAACPKPPSAGDRRGPGADRRQAAGVVRANARIIVLGLLILASGTIITYVTQYMTTYAENTLHVATDLAFATTVVSNGLGIVGALCGGWLADRSGRWPVMVWPQLAALLADLSGFPVDRGGAQRLGAAGRPRLLSLVGTIPYSAFYVAFTESLPKTIRGGACATIYAVAIAGFRRHGANGRHLAHPCRRAMRWRPPGTCCSRRPSDSPP